jgi:hypothetical protein
MAGILRSRHYESICVQLRIGPSYTEALVPVRSRRWAGVAKELYGRSFGVSSVTVLPFQIYRFPMQDYSMQGPNHVVQCSFCPLLVDAKVKDI